MVSTTPDTMRSSKSKDFGEVIPTEVTEALDVIELFGLNFHCGEAFKYIARAGKKKYQGKDAAECEIIDLEKAVVYLNRKIALIKDQDILDYRGMDN